MAARDLSNLAALIGVQGANAALPLIVFPHLLSVAGHDHYARIAISEALALAVLTVALYSFDIDALERVVGLQPGRDTAAISRAFSGVLLARLIMFSIGATVALSGCALLAPQLVVPLAWWLLLPLSHVLQSAWMFQGLERNAPIATAMIISRISGIVLILAFVTGPNDSLRVPAFVGVTALLGAISLLTYARLAYGLRLCRVPQSELAGLFRRGRTIFLGNASVFMYRDLNVVLLGSAGAGAAAVAAYSMAEKLIKGLQAAARPLNQLFFPKALGALSALAAGPAGARADRRSLRVLLRLTVPQWLALAGLVALLALASWAFADSVPLLRDLPERAAIAALLVAMVPAVFFGVGNFMLGSVGLNHLGERRYMFFSLLTVGALNILICQALALGFGAPGAAAAFVLSEVLLAVFVWTRYLRPTDTGATRA